MSNTKSLVVSGLKEIPDSYVGTIEPNYYCRGWNSTRSKYCKARAGTGTDHPGQGRCKNHGGATPIKGGRYSTIKRERIRVLVEEFEQDPDPLDVLPELYLVRALMRDFIERYDEWRDALVAWHETFRATGRPVPYALQHSLERCLDEYENLLNEQGESTDQQEKDLDEARKLVQVLSSPVEGKPVTVLDLSDAVRHADTVSKMVKRIEDVRSQDAVSRRDLARILSEIVRSVDLRIKDPDVRQQIHDDIISIRL